MTETTFTDNVKIDGSQDIEQLRIQGHTAQEQPLQTWENSAGDVLAQVTGDGRLVVGDSDASPNSLIEAHQTDDSLSKPNRGFHSSGQVSNEVDPLDELIEWIVGELELKGSTNIDALHTALRIRASNKNTGIPTGNAELRGADIEVINDADASDDPLTKVTGLQVNVTNETDKAITEAIGLKIKMTNDGTITNPFSIYTEGDGPIHLEDYIEVKKPASTPGTPDADFIRIYLKDDGKLYAKNSDGTEFDLTNPGAVTSVNSQTGDVTLTSDDIAEGSTNQYYTNERVDDRVAALLTAGANINLSYDDAGNALTLSVTGLTAADISNFSEAVDDRVNGLFTAGSNIAFTYDDVANTFTINFTGTLATSVLTGVLQAAQFPALTGDVTTVAGALATTLATVNSNVGSFAAADITVNGKGLITAAASAAASGTGNLVRATAPTLSNPVVTGGSIDNTPIGATTPSTGYFSALWAKIGGFFGKFVHTNTADRTYTFPDYDGTVATLAGTETFTNKTLTSPVINTGVSGSAVDTDETLAANSNTIIAPQKAVKGYLDKYGPVKRFARVATTGALPANTYNNGTAGVGATLTGNAVGALVVDSKTIALNDRIIVQGETPTTHNGIYICTTAGNGSTAYVLTRATDSDTPAKLAKSVTLAVDGTSLIYNFFLCNFVATQTIGTDSVTFRQLTGSLSLNIGSGLTQGGNVLNIDTAVVSTLTGSQILTNKTLTSPVINTGVSGSAIDTDGTLTANSDTLLASQKATKAYVDAVGLRQPARLATTGTLPANTYSNGSSGVGATLTGTATGALVVDGVTVALNDRIIVQGEASTEHNGIYICTTAGALGVAYVLTRATDADTPAKLAKSVTLALEGTSLAYNFFLCNFIGIQIIGTGFVSFRQLTGSLSLNIGTGLTQGGNVLNPDISYLATVATSQTLTNKTLTSPVINTGVSGSAIDTDGTLAANSDTLLASQKAVKTYAASKAGANTFLGANDFTAGSILLPENQGTLSTAEIDWDTTLAMAFIGDSQRNRALSANGWAAWAYHQGMQWSTNVAGANITLAANGGTLVFPITVSAHMLLSSIAIGFGDTTLARSYGWGIFDMPFNNGNSGENTLPLRVAISANDSYTAAASGLRSTVPSTDPFYLPPGTYMMAIQNRHASNTLAIQTFAQGVYTGQTMAKTKTLTNPFGSSIDIVTATWTAQTVIPAVRLKGRIAGMTSVWG